MQVPDVCRDTLGKVKEFPHLVLQPLMRQLVACCLMYLMSVRRVNGEESELPGRDVYGYLFVCRTNRATYFWVWRSSRLASVS
jgi:hypothetical protein